MKRVMLFCCVLFLIVGCEELPEDISLPAEQVPEEMPEENTFPEKKPLEEPVQEGLERFKALEQEVNWVLAEQKEVSRERYEQLSQELDTLKVEASLWSPLRRKLDRIKQGITQRESRAENVPPEKNCEGGRIQFSHLPVNLEKVRHIDPMGGLSGEHVAPIDHLYFQDFTNDKQDIEVYAPASGVITTIGHMGSFRGDDKNQKPMDDYRVVIEHTCTISTIFIHIDTLAPRLQAVAPEFGKWVSPYLPVDAGELLGMFDSNVDFNVVDKEFEIQWINPESYMQDENRKHIQDPFAYFDEPFYSQLSAKSLRSSPPYGGTIDYDVAGTLQGTWFREGTNGWSGLTRDRYWADHLAIVPDHIDENHIWVSLGTFQGKARQFGVKGNSPHPKDVTSASGVVKYELVDGRYYDGNTEWNYRSFVRGLNIRNSNEVQGVVFLQMLDGRTLNVEVFPDKTAYQVQGFTEKAQRYVR